MRWALILLLAACTSPPDPPPRALPPPLACEAPAPPPAAPMPPRTVERLAHFAVVLELSREAANTSLADCTDKLERLQRWIEEHD
jgi:hypothetical protein